MVESSETKQEKTLKKLQLWIAVFAGLATFIVGAYNIKNIVLSKKGPGAVLIQVSDENGQPIPSAGVQIEQVQGGVIASTSTSADGKYEQNKILPGNYSLKVEKAGFQAATMLFAIESGNKSALNVALKPNSSSIRSSVEEVGASWIKKLGMPKDKEQPTAN